MDYAVYNNWNPSLNSKYELLEKIGEGAFGTVYRVKHKETKKIFAAKFLPRTDDNSIKRELSVFRKLPVHLNILKIVDVFETDTPNKGHVLVMPYCENGTVNERILGKQISLQQKKRFMRDVLSGIAHLHDHNIIHLDLKPDNFLLDRDDCVKISDFGIAKAYSNTRKAAASLYYYNSASPGTILLPQYYRPPEIIQALSIDQFNTRITKNVDIYQAGCSFIAMIQEKAVDWMDGKLLLAPYFTNRHNERVSLADAQLDEAFDEEVKMMFDQLRTSGLCDILRSMTHSNARARPSASALLEKMGSLNVIKKTRIKLIFFFIALIIFIAFVTQTLLYE